MEHEPQRLALGHLPPRGDADGPTHATLEWCCAVCCRVNRHWPYQDGAPRRIDCRGCGAVGGVLIPTGPAMAARAGLSLERVECAQCGTTFSERTHGCHVCRGETVETAEGRVIA